MTTHMLMRVVHVEAGFRWVCTCGERGPAAVDWQAARDLHAIHRAKHQERVQ